jgi:hypothetical protein
MECFFAILRAEYALNEKDEVTIVNDSACLLSTRRIKLQLCFRSQFDRWAIFSSLNSDSMPSRPNRRRGYLIDHEGSEVSNKRT